MLAVSSVTSPEPTGEKKGSRMNSLALVQQPVIDMAIASNSGGRTSRIRIFSPRWFARENDRKLARPLGLHLVEDRPRRAGLEFAQDRGRHLIVHRGDLSCGGLRLHLGVNGDKVVACRLEHRVALRHPFLHRRFRFFEIGEPLLDLRVELAELFRLPGDARLGDRWGGVGAEAAGLDIRRFVRSGFIWRFVRSGFWLFLLGRPPILSEGWTGKENGGDAQRHARATRSSRQALRQRRRGHVSASRMGGSSIARLALG